MNTFTLTSERTGNRIWTFGLLSDLTKSRQVGTWKAHWGVCQVKDCLRTGRGTYSLCCSVCIWIFYAKWESVNEVSERFFPDCSFGWSTQRLVVMHSASWWQVAKNTPRYNWYSILRFAGVQTIRKIDHDILCEMYPGCRVQGQQCLLLCIECACMGSIPIHHVGATERRPSGGVYIHPKTADTTCTSQNKQPLSICVRRTKHLLPFHDIHHWTGHYTSADNRNRNSWVSTAIHKSAIWVVSFEDTITQKDVWQPQYYCLEERCIPWNIFLQVLIFPHKPQTISKLESHYQLVCTASHEALSGCYVTDRPSQLSVVTDSWVNARKR